MGWFKSASVAGCLKNKYGYSETDSIEAARVLNYTKVLPGTDLPLKKFNANEIAAWLAIMSLTQEQIWLKRWELNQVEKIIDRDFEVGKIDSFAKAVLNSGLDSVKENRYAVANILDSMIEAGGKAVVEVPLQAIVDWVETKGNARDVSCHLGRDSVSFTTNQNEKRVRWYARQKGILSMESSINVQSVLIEGSPEAAVHDALAFSTEFRELDEDFIEVLSQQLALDLRTRIRQFQSESSNEESEIRVLEEKLGQFLGGDEEKIKKNLDRYKGNNEFQLLRKCFVENCRRLVGFEVTSIYGEVVLEEMHMKNPKIGSV